MITPDLVYFVYGFASDFDYTAYGIVPHVVGILYLISDLIDALIYIFMKKNVRELLVKKLQTLYANICCHGNRNDVTTPMISDGTTITVNETMPTNV